MTKMEEIARLEAIRAELHAKKELAWKLGRQAGEDDLRIKQRLDKLLREAA